MYCLEVESATRKSSDGFVEFHVDVLDFLTRRSLKIVGHWDDSGSLGDLILVACLLSVIEELQDCSRIGSIERHNDRARRFKVLMSHFDFPGVVRRIGIAQTVIAEVENVTKTRWDLLCSFSFRATLGAMGRISEFVGLGIFA